MQKHHLGFTGFICLFLFIGCQKEIGPSENAGASAFSAEIDSAAWEANLLKGITRTNGVIALMGQNASRKQIIMRVADSGIHNYSFNSTSAANVAIYTDSASGNINPFTTNQWLTPGLYGRLNITAIDTANKLMSGSFSFRAYRMMDSTIRNISNGVFTNVPYSTGIVTAPGNDTFRAKINGVDFSYINFLATRPPGQGLISLGGYNNGTAGVPSLGLSLPDSIGTGTRNFALLGPYIGLYNLSTSSIYSADSGTVVINEHNNTTRRIRGSFNFRAVKFIPPTDTLRITEGFFSATYQ